MPCSIATPEYAGGMPGSLKNAPTGSSGPAQLYGKPVVVISVAPSAERGGNARGWVEDVVRMQGSRVAASFTVAVSPAEVSGDLEPVARVVWAWSSTALHDESGPAPSTHTARRSRKCPERLAPRCLDGRRRDGRNRCQENFENADERRTPDKTQIEVVDLGSVKAARMTLEPGWKWSDCIKPIVGTESCQIRHVGSVVRPDATSRTTTAPRVSSVPGDAYVIEPGHDAWVVGSEPVVGYEFDSQAAATYSQS